MSVPPFTDAADGARGQADTLATAGTLQVDGVVSIDATDRNYSPVRYQTETTDAAAGDDTSIDVGDASVSVDVQVVYRRFEASASGSDGNL